jgi:hypothetical protein
MKNFTPMRKVQSIIGPVLIITAALAYFVSVYFLIIVVLIGFGLTRSGLTGVCPMENVIARMQNKNASNNPDTPSQ